MTSPETAPELRYLPFWTLYDYLGDTPPHPFIPVYVLKEYVRNATGPDGNVSYDAVHIAIHKPDSDLVATDIPQDMLINPAELVDWADRIAGWFRDHAVELVSARSEDEEG